MPGLFSAEMLPPELQDMIKDMSPEKKEAFLKMYMENMLGNSTQGTDVPPVSPVNTKPLNLDVQF